MIQRAGGDIGAFGLDAEYVLGVLLIGDTHVHILAQISHGLFGLLAGP